MGAAASQQDVADPISALVDVPLPTVHALHQRFAAAPGTTPAMLPRSAFRDAVRACALDDATTAVTDLLFTICDSSGSNEVHREHFTFVLCALAAAPLEDRIHLGLEFASKESKRGRVSAGDLRRVLAGMNDAVNAFGNPSLTDAQLDRVVTDAAGKAAAADAPLEDTIAAAARCARHEAVQALVQGRGGRAPRPPHSEAPARPASTRGGSLVRAGSSLSVSARGGGGSLRLAAAGGDSAGAAVVRAQVSSNAAASGEPAEPAAAGAAATDVHDADGQRGAESADE